MIAVDTNVLLRYIVRDDLAQFNAAEQLMLQHDWWISHTVLLETEWVLRSAYGLRADQFAQILKHLLSASSIIWQDESVVQQALDWFENHNTDFADALHAVQCPAEVKFASFDKKLVHIMKKSKRPVVVGL
jgi:predicted nucleic-acid-binding protein